MPYDRFLIAPYDKSSGLQNNVKPFLIPDEAFSRLNNAYQWRGRVRKRFGSRWLGGTQQLTRLKINIGSTDGSGTLSGTVPGIIFKPGQSFSIGNAWYTVYLIGAVQPMLKTVTTTTATYSTTDGAFNFVGAPINTIIYFYPAEPVMGLRTFYTNAENQPSTIAFDTQFAYQYMTTGWERIAGETQSGAATWTGSDSQLFWSETYSNTDPSNFTLYVTNFNEDEPNYMRYLFNNTWNNFVPELTNVPANSENFFLVSSSMVFQYHNRLIAINTWEQNQYGMAPYPFAIHYPFRVRSSQIGDPTGSLAWRTDISGHGYGIDIPTQEAIITASFVKDQLILYCEQSTWALIYTANKSEPFIARQINTELGAESRFSVIPHDRVCLCWGDTGLHACNGTNVDRIDNSIPDEVFNVHNEDAGVERIFGIRDYNTEMDYWSYPTPSRSDSMPYPNKILVYNYKTATWSFNDDSITCFGYIEPIVPPDWSSQTILWTDNEPWSGNQLQNISRNVIAGNQEGFTFIIDSNSPINAMNLQITNISSGGSTNLFIFNIVNHNLSSGTYIYFSGIQGTGNLNLFNQKIFQLVTIIDKDNFYILYSDIIHSIVSGVYSGNGNISTISQIDIITKQYNFYFKDGRNIYVPKIDFLVDSSFAGQITIDYFVSTSGISLVNASSAIGTNSIVGTSVLETFPYPAVPFEEFSTQVWHPVYFQADGEFIQLRFYNTPSQLLDPNIQSSDFQLHAMNIYATPTSYRNQ